MIGVGMTKFEKPGKSMDYPDMAHEAATKALADAGVSYREIEQVAVGYCYGDSTSGQRAVYSLGLTGVPIYNVNNNCATGSTALYMARQFIAAGNECVMALGFEKMQRGSLSSTYNDRANPLEHHMANMMELREFDMRAPPAAQIFGNAGREHMEKYGSTKQQLAKIAWKNHKHSTNNPYSQFRDEYTLQQVLESRSVYEPLTMLQCCPTSDGAACAILASEEFVRRHGLESQAIEIAGMALVTDFASTFEEKSCIKVAGADMSREAARRAFSQAGLTPADVQVVELHDCFSANELITYEALGLCGEGQAGNFIDAGDNTYGGKYVVNPSGGLISKGHPLGATGLAQCSELVWQLREMTGARQVPNVRAALQHNLGLGGAAVVAVYRLGFPDKFKPYNKPFNPAVTADPLPQQASKL